MVFWSLNKGIRLLAWILSSVESKYDCWGYLSVFLLSQLLQFFIAESHSFLALFEAGEKAQDIALGLVQVDSYRCSNCCIYSFIFWSLIIHDANGVASSTH